ncbi:hypothetical protein F7R01_22195 [Pseudomonas argentinensis]|uniref:Phage antitermination protein Q n=1 Tax=Phytopseudomonas argentinensis TaxID=289370 RepID=A0A1I3PE91_9GAMM|nr:hypothetical protein [Pseudomonas argentinensis]KAB0546150.1 hypothetical protein F7R01_22195 [Pseudomonas argentinensis]SFJ19336.1 hypothetical protein SAMN05216602_4215 [Pseudomonas argentinensis]
MIPYIDEALQRWAEAQASEADCTSNMGNSVIASLMASQGVLNRAARGSRVLVNRVTEIGWILSKHLSPEQRQVVIEQYCSNLPQREKWVACGCSRAQFYRRLGQAHRAIESQLLKRAV